MKIFDILELNRDEQNFWIEKMKKCDWDAGGWLVALVDEGKVAETFGESSKVYLLTVGEDLCAFCSLVPQDEIDDRTMMPWVGFVYTFPEHRGHRYSGALIEEAKKEAVKEGFDKIYVSSEEVGLYEKYGFTFVEHRKSIHGYMTGIFVCELNK